MMKKQQRKELESSLYQLIDAHLSHHSPGASDKIQKTIRAASKGIAKKFSKALKKADGPKKSVKSKPAARTGASKK